MPEAPTGTTATDEQVRTLAREVLARSEYDRWRPHNAWAQVLERFESWIEAQVDALREWLPDWMMHLIDAFATFEPIDLRVMVDTVAETDERTVLRIQVSPQPEEHGIWRSLEAAIASIREP